MPRYKKKQTYRNVIDTSVIVTIQDEKMFDVLLVTEKGVKFSIPWTQFHQDYRKVQ